jgi:acyl-CoA synthetase (AMP-forming)/AMP-acid ligase II
MSLVPLAGCGLAPVYRDDERLQPLIGPGGPFEVAELVLDGVPVRDFVRKPALTIVDAFRFGASHADRIHIVNNAERLTFSEVRERARMLARELQESFGVRAGDRVAIAMRNLPEFIISFWGGALLGAIVVPINSWGAGPELVYALDNSGAKVAFVDSERADRVLDSGRPAGVHLIGVRGAACDAPFDELLRGAPLAEEKFAQLGQDDPVTILYTSGTTGRPKGALGTNRNHMSSLLNMAFATARDSLISGRSPQSPKQPATISSGPLFHIGGVHGIIGGQMSGSKLVMLQKWNVEAWTRLAVEEQITTLGGVPATLRQILDLPGVNTLGLDARTIPMGGAPVPPDLPLRSREVFPDAAILNGYGLTETTSAVCANVGDEYAAHPDSVGRPNLTSDIKVVDTDGAELGLGEIGELCFRSSQVVQGYWNNAEATAESFIDGWFHSGDVGFVDPMGYVRVVDRKKDVVIRGGENVYCVEVEADLQEHPAIDQVAVVGVVEPRMGERVCAVVVLRPGASLTLPELRDFASKRLASFKCPEAIVIVDELPTTASGKVAKNIVRNQIAAGADIAHLW